MPRMFRGPDVTQHMAPVPTGACSRCRDKDIPIYQLIDVNGVVICWECGEECKREGIRWSFNAKGQVRGPDIELTPAGNIKPRDRQRRKLSDADRDEIVERGRAIAGGRYGGVKKASEMLAPEYNVAVSYIAWLISSGGKRSV